MSSVARRAARAFVVVAALVPAACMTTHNYLDPAGPKYEGGFASERMPEAAQVPGSSLLVVTFNIEYGRDIDGAVALLRSRAELRDPDILLLQEMSPAGVERMARELRLNYAYYPSTVHPMAKQDYGTAVLSPWPLDEPRKLVLPWAAFGTRARRAPTSAVVHVNDLRIRAMAVHLPAPGSIRTEERAEQVQLIMTELAAHAGPVVVGGDFNSRSIGRLFTQGGFRWLTERLPGTSYGFGHWWKYDHVFARGLEPAGGSPSAGVVDPGSVSDHRVVWVRLKPQNTNEMVKLTPSDEGVTCSAPRTAARPEM
jgi:endonuclease/exonuclease/phosphatase family metal-dependent hydrolase